VTKQHVTLWLLIAGLLLVVSTGCANRNDRDQYYERETIHRDSFPETYARDSWDGPVTYGRV
jgi:hypothetical protein